MNSVATDSGRGSIPAFVASTGGHLVQLSGLAPLIEPERHHDGLWITHENDQSRSLLEGRNVVFVPLVETRRLDHVLTRTSTVLRLLRRHHVDTVYSTGAAIAISALPLAPLVGARPVFIESLARADGPSVSGRVNRRVPWVQCWTQYPGNAGNGWSYRFSLLDTFELEPPVPRTPRKVLVTVGTVRLWGFRRMLERVRAVLPEDSEVVWQTGASDLSGLDLPGRVVEVFSDAEFQAEIDRSDVVVSHSGVGSLLRTLGSGQTPVLVPRRAANGEHVDDHQTQIAGVAAARGLAVVKEAGDLEYDDLVRAAAGRVRHRGDDE